MIKYRIREGQDWSWGLIGGGQIEEPVSRGAWGGSLGQ